MRIIHSQTTPSRITLFSSTARITLFSVTSRITFLINCENYSLLSNFENHFSPQLRELLSFSSNTGNIILNLNSEKASSNLREECRKRLKCSDGRPTRLTTQTQACDFVGYYVIYVNLSKMEVIYVFFLRLLCYFLGKVGLNFIFLCERQEKASLCM